MDSSKIRQLIKEEVNSIIRDRKILYQKAHKAHERGLSAAAFEAFCRKTWPDKIENIGGKTFAHLLAMIWGED